MTSAVRNFVNTIIDSAEDLAIFECGKPDEETLARLKHLSATLRDDLSPIVGSSMAAALVDGFCAGVMGGKHEREALAAMHLL